MRKILSAFLMVVVTLQLSAMDVLALGKDEVVWGKNGKHSKTIYVSSEKLDDYLKGLQQEIDQCWNKYEYWHGENSWRDVLAIFSSIIVPPVLLTFCAYKIMKFFNRHTRKTVKETQSEPVIEETEDGKYKVVEKPVSTTEKKDDSLSLIQYVVLGLSMALGFICSDHLLGKFSPLKNFTICRQKELRNKEIIKFAEIRRLKDEADIYGIEVNCLKGDEGDCMTNSQKYLIKPNIF